MNLELRDKVVLISGGASGIGEACARLFAAEGACVAIVDQDAARGHEVIVDLKRGGANALCIRANLVDDAACEHAIAEARRHFGKLDVLVNNAGGNDAVGLERPAADFVASLQRNLVHVFGLCHHARELLISARGAVVNVSSKVAVTGQGGTSGYAAAKGGVNALTREWALALAPQGVRVNCVVPAECDTPRYQRWFATQPDPAAARRAVELLVPLGQRLTTPDEVAATIVWLASPRSAHTTGQIIYVDGGYTHLDRAASHGHARWRV
jgi:L-fucose dehydrogenase